jgi:hypothetical protein
MILGASVLYNEPQENQAVDQLLPLLHPLVHLNLQVGGTLYKTDATSIMLDYLPADLGEPKGEEVGVADLLPICIVQCAKENQTVDQLPPLLHPLVHLNLQVGNLA